MNSILLTITIYLLATIIIPALALPTYLVYKPRYKAQNPKLKQEITHLKKIKNERALVKAAFNYTTNHFHAAGPLGFIIALPKLFRSDPNKTINQKGVAFCHTQNALIKTLLLETGRFSPDNIKEKITITLVIHQYLKLTFKDGTTIDLDPWGFHKGAPYSKHLNTFNFISYFLKHPQL